VKAPHPMGGRIIQRRGGRVLDLERKLDRGFP